MNAMMEQLQSARHRGALGDLALHFAGLVTRLDSVADDGVVLAAALTSQQAVSGEVCVDLNEVSGSMVLVDEDGRGIMAPDLERWLIGLRCSSMVGHGDAYRPLVFELLPQSFTLTELQKTVEALSGGLLHKQNFRRMVESAGLVEPTDETRSEGRGRPARLYRFRSEVTAERPAPGVRARPRKH